MEPWRLAFAQGFEAGEAFLELLLRPFGLLRVVEFVVAQRPVDGLVEDADVRQEGEGRPVL